jgi:hypothetical protein
MVRIELNIIDFLIQMDMVETGGPTLGHRAFLKSFYGLKLNGEELDFYYRATGRKIYIPLEQKEVTAIIGRRGGKTRLAAQIAVFEAFRHKLPRGKRAFILVIAPVLRQSETAFDYISEYIHGSPVLLRSIVEERKSEIKLRNGITIRCQPCNTTVRGLSVVCAICDEVGFWIHEQTAANPEEQVMAALRPTMATFRDAKLIKISTPCRKEGILWRDLQDRQNLRYTVRQLSTKDMNPTISDEVLEEARCDNEEYFRREFLAQFTDSLVGWITPEMLDPCIARGQREFPRVFSGTYIAAVDPAFRNSDFGFAILHRSDDGHITVAYTARWSGTRKNPLNCDSVCAQIKDVLRRYEINSLIGDQYCFPVLKDRFRQLEIFYREISFGSHTRASIYGNLRQLIAQQKITIVEEPELLRQLRYLEEIRSPNGNIDVRPPGSSKDDMAIAVALAASELSHVPERSPGIVLRISEPTILVRHTGLWYDEIVGSTCHKYPGCFIGETRCVCYP